MNPQDQDQSPQSAQPTQPSYPQPDATISQNDAAQLQAIESDTTQPLPVAPAPATPVPQPQPASQTDWSAPQPATEIIQPVPAPTTSQEAPLSATPSDPFAPQPQPEVQQPAMPTEPTSPATQDLAAQSVAPVAPVVPTQAAETAPAGKKPASKVLFIVVGVLVLAAAVAGYFLWQTLSTEPAAPVEQTTQTVPAEEDTGGDLPGGGDAEVDVQPLQ